MSKIKEIRLNASPEHDSLYKWALQECEKDKKGPDYVPFPFTCRFIIEKIGLDKSFNSEETKNKKKKILENESLEDLDREDKIEEINYKENDRIYANLIPLGKGKYANFLRTEYSIFGTNRNIKDIYFNIIKSTEDYCKATAYLEDNYEIDFEEEYAPDSLYFSMYLNTAQFDKVVEMINSNQIKDAYINVSCRGFYAEWSPGTKASLVKILLPSQRKLIKVPKKFDYNIGSLGLILNFDLNFSSKYEINISENDEELNEEDELNLQEEKEKKIEYDIKLNKVLDAYLNFNKSYNKNSIYIIALLFGILLILIIK